jgi:hypothetical protein
MTVPIQSQIFNPVTGVFGTGQISWFNASGTWTVPAGIAKCRVRVWGAGGSATTGGGAGGGFAMRTLYDLSGVISVAVMVGTAATNTTGGTSSFGSYVSATGGSNTTAGGTGIGGDVNNTGGAGPNISQGGGGGVASFFGNGGSGSSSNGGNGAGGAGGGGGSQTSHSGGGGFLSVGTIGIVTSGTPTAPTTGINGSFSIDFIGCGGGGASNVSSTNGGGGGGSTPQPGAFPGGGGGGTGLGAPGLVIVEY